MNRTNLTAVAVCLAAGTVLSVAQAGDQPSMRKIPTTTASSGAAGRTWKESDFQVVNPSKMIINGRSVPFTVSEELGSVGSTDTVPVMLYNSFTDSGTNLYSGSATVGTSTVPINAALDDIQFANTATGITVGGFRMRWATGANIGTADSYFIALQWWDGFSGAGSPVNTNYGGFMAVQWDAPASGWASGAAYRSSYLTSGFTPGDFLTAGTSGAMEWSALALDINGNPDTVVYPHVSPIFTSSAPSTGTSSNPGFFFANNVLDANAVGAYPSPALQFADSSNNPILSNISMTITGFAAPSAAYGACCLPNAPTGGCVLLQSSICTAQGGVFKGGTDCGLNNANKCAGLTAGIAFGNGPISTGTVSYSGVAAAAGNLWAESVTQKNAGTGDSCIANLGGLGFWGGFRGSDDFIVPAGETWTVSAITVYLFSPNAASTRAPITTGTLALWNGFPDAAGSSIVAGDRTTARTPTQTITNMYFNFSTADNTSTVPTTAFRNWAVSLPLPSAVTLNPGHYYFDFDYTGQPAAGSYSGFVSVMTSAPAGGTFDNGGGNSLTGFFSGTPPVSWGGIYDDPFGVDAAGNVVVDGTCLPYQFDLPFQVVGTRTVTTPACYANCTGNTDLPLLSAADFTCFLNKFRAGDQYANCNGNTDAPTLTAADFTCFLNKFRAGCP